MELVTKEVKTEAVEMHFVWLVIRVHFIIIFLEQMFAGVYCAFLLSRHVVVFI